MATLSLKDTAFALNAPTSEAWSLKGSLAVPPVPAPPAGTLSVRRLARRFSAAGAALRQFEGGAANAWTHLTRSQLTLELRNRVRDPFIMRQRLTGLCGPLSVLMELARRNPGRYITFAKQLYETGQFTCPTGRVIVAEQELRDEPVPAGVDDSGAPWSLAQIDWMMAGTMRDDENIWDDVDDTANYLETITLWAEQAGWTRDLLGMPNGDYETCFWSGETDCMRLAEQTVKAGGVAFLLVDANLIQNGETDTEEDMRWSRTHHFWDGTEEDPGAHSGDDCPPPDHWVVYLGGFNLGDDPDDSDPVTVRVWSWGAEYVITGTVDAFVEYLYGVVIGK